MNYVWVYYRGQIDNVIPEYNVLENLVEKYPDAIYFYADLVMED
jgi:hypothetical protein